MFKGLKKAVKGGISTVAETGGNLAGKVVGDPVDLKDKLQEGAKRTLQTGQQLLDDGVEKVKETNAVEVKDKTKDVAHKVKHHGAFAEDYLGYADPGKELRKAVKAKEKAAKKARKEKKKKGQKTEDLFDPANLAKYKKELEEKRKHAEEEGAAGDPAEAVSDTNSDNGRQHLHLELGQTQQPAWSNEASPDFDFASPTDQQGGKEVGDDKSPCASSSHADNDEWKRFQALTSGLDKVLKEKQDKLEEIKAESYYQRKKTQVEILEDSKVERSTTLVDKRKKKWEDLDAEGFEEREGIVVAEVSDTEDQEDEEKAKESTEELDGKAAEEEKEPEPQEPEKPAGYVDIPEDDVVDPEEDEDIFDTAIADALVNGDIRLNVIPDSPEPEDEEDPFDTKFAEDIVTKHEKERKVREKFENNRIKFGSISAAADVLSGKAVKVDKHAVDHAVKKKRRRANRINLIAEEVDDVTAADEIEGYTAEDETNEDNKKVDVFAVEEEALEVPVADLLSSTAHTPTQSQEKPEDPPVEDILGAALSEDLKEFDVVQKEDVALTSNVALLEAEFCEAQVEEEDPFDEAFDQLAKESVSKDRLKEIEEDLFKDDLFDTSKADEVLKLASITKEVVKDKEQPEVQLDDFEDKDPFDTSAYEHLTKDLEEDLEFEALAKRDPHETVGGETSEIGPDPFDVIDRQLQQQQSTDEDNWAAFDQPKKKPSRPPPPRPAPPPRPPKSSSTAPAVQIDYASGRNTPSVIVKAPSSESIKSWNVTQAETLIYKSNIEAIEASSLEEQTEFDPFDTTEYEEVVADLQAKDKAPSKAELELLEKEILRSGNSPGDKDTSQSNLELLAKELNPDDNSVDPFDTDYVGEVLPDKDPFDTSEVSKDILKDTEVDDDFDPFDTTVADKVIPVRKPAVNQRSIVSIEDDDFDPTKSFKSKIKPQRPQLPEKVVDPFFVENTDESQLVTGEVLVPKQGGKATKESSNQEDTKNKGIKELEDELLNDIGGPLKRSYTDEDFDPRGFDSPEEVVDPDEVDPFDTSAIQIA